MNRLQSIGGKTTSKERYQTGYRLPAYRHQNGEWSGYARLPRRVKPVKLVAVRLPSRTCAVLLSHTSQALFALLRSKVMTSGRRIQFLACCDSAVIGAEAFQDDTSSRDALEKQEEKLRNQGFLPSDMRQNLEFMVYWLQGSKFWSHASIVFTSDKKHYVTAELQWYFIDGTRHVLPWANYFFDESIVASTRRNLTRIGTVKMTAQELIDAGIAAMKKFGKYHRYTNNCQNYCNLVLEEIKLKKQWTSFNLSLLASGPFAPFLYGAAKLRETFN